MDNKPLILVVEDEKPIRNFMCVSLEAQGYKCIDTQHGKTAISLVSAHNPDIIIIDLGLPDIDGIFNSSLRQKEELSCPIITYN